MSKKIIITRVAGIILLLSCHSSPKISTQAEFEHKASALYEDDRYRDAIPYYNFLIYLDHDKGEYYYRRAYCYGEIKNFRAALGDYQKAIMYNYRISNCYYNSGLDEFQIGDDSASLHFYHLYLAREPFDRLNVAALIKISEDRIRMKKTDAWKDYEDYLNRQKHKLLMTDTLK